MRSMKEINKELRAKSRGGYLFGMRMVTLRIRRSRPRREEAQEHPGRGKGTCQNPRKFGKQRSPARLARNE